MKQVIVVFISLILFSCGNKQAEKQSAPSKMNGIEFAKKYGIELPFLDYSTEEATAKGGNSGGNKKPKANAVVLAVWSNDLVLTESGGVLTTTLSANAEWGGVQRWNTVDTLTTGVSICNWNWSNSTAPSTQTCAVNGAGSYRSWTSDKVTYDIHVSSFLVVQ